jgi:hypothetical protein
MPSSWSGKLLIFAVAVGGLLTMGYAVMHPSSSNPIRFFSFLVIAVVASRLKVKLPGVDGNMSVNLPFFLIACAELGLAQALAVGVAGAVAQSIQNKTPMKPVQILFNVCTIALSVTAASWMHHMPAPNHGFEQPGAMLLLSGVGYLLVNTIPVAGIVAITSQQAALKVWSGIVSWSFPYYLLSTAVAEVVLMFDRYVDWRAPLVLLPLMFVVYRSYRKYFGAAATQTKMASAAAA